MHLLILCPLRLGISSKHAEPLRRTMVIERKQDAPSHIIVSFDDGGG